MSSNPPAMPMIFKQISLVMSEINAVGKEKTNSQQGFKFRGIDDVLNEIHPRLSKHGIFIVPKVLEERREERQTKSGSVMNYVIMKIEYTFYAEDGSNVVATMIGEGADSGDKASNKAQSIALKYACLQVFAIPTEDMDDGDATTTELAPKAALTDDRRVQEISELASKFRKIGVSETMICNRYKLKDLGELTGNHISELNDIGWSIKNGKTKKADHFGADQKKG